MVVKMTGQSLGILASTIMVAIVSDGCGEMKVADAIVVDTRSEFVVATKPPDGNGPGYGDVFKKVNPQEKPKPPVTPVDPVVENPVDGIPFTNAEALDFLSRRCAACHGTNMAYHSFWPQPELLTKTLIENDPFKEAVYQSIYNNARSFQGTSQPAMMPPKSQRPVDVEQSRRMIGWYRKELPDVAFSADKKFGNSDSNIAGINYKFSCATPLTIRQYVRKLSNDAFGREPTSVEINAFGDPEKPVTEAVRAAMAARITAVQSPEWKEFRGYGLRVFARKFAGANEIKPQISEGITQAVADDLKSEFYEKLLADVETVSFRDILLSDRVMVTSRTASLYGAPSAECQVPVADGWAPCKMPAERQTYWSSIGFLASRPTSFLSINNNYGRAALLQFGINGEMFLAATDGPKGDKVEPLPSCLKIKDFRGEEQPDKSIAPFGATKVPQSGNICQSCHIARNLALGSLLFRPFTSAGNIFQKDQVHPNDPIYGEKVQQATASDKIWQDGSVGTVLSVDYRYLQSLLDRSPDSESGCIPKGGPGGADLPVNNVKEFASYLMGEGVERLGAGLARHIPRAISNSESTTSEISEAVTEALVKSNGKLMSAIEAYFKSETYACSNSASAVKREGK